MGVWNCVSIVLNWNFFISTALNRRVVLLVVYLVVSSLKQNDYCTFNSFTFLNLRFFRAEYLYFEG